MEAWAGAHPAVPRSLHRLRAGGLRLRAPRASRRQARTCRGRAPASYGVNGVLQDPTAETTPRAGTESPRGRERVFFRLCQLRCEPRRLPWRLRVTARFRWLLPGQAPRLALALPYAVTDNATFTRDTAGARWCWCARGSLPDTPAEYPVRRNQGEERSVPEMGQAQVWLVHSPPHPGTSRSCKPQLPPE